MPQVLPCISIIIPFLNRASLFHRPLQSIKPCRGMVTEVILVDNGSTDQAPQMAVEFAESLKNNEWMRVKILSCPKGNASAARNAGLAEASGRWVYFFDSDDAFSQDFLPDFHAFSLLHKTDDLIALRTSTVMSDGRRVDRACLYSDSPVDQILSSHLSTQCMVFKREFILKIGGWNEDVFRWDDWELGLRALLHSPGMHWMKGRTYHSIYQHEESITGKDESTTLERSLSALEVARKLIVHSASCPQSIQYKSTAPQSSCTYTGSKMIHALAAREAILAGRLSAENSRDSARCIMNRAYETLALDQGRTPLIYIRSAVWKLFLKILFTYVARGHRGAWRLALTLARHT